MSPGAERATRFTQQPEICSRKPGPGRILVLWSHQPQFNSKLTFEGATPCPLKISQPSHPCQGLLPVDTPHSVCRDYILQPCSPGAHECSLPLAGRVQEGQDAQSLLLSKLGCLLSRPHIIIPALPSRQLQEASCPTAQAGVPKVIPNYEWSPNTTSWSHEGT